MISPRDRSTLVATTAVGFIVVVLLLVSGCTSRPKVHEEPAPTRTTPLNTIEASNVGVRIIVTAGVETVLSPQSFVVIDSDLPGDGLLVLGQAPAGLERPDLVTVYGVIDRFHHGHFADRYDLAPAPRYRRYEGRKFVVAADVTART